MSASPSNKKTKYRPNDVICGQGKFTNPGNVFCLQLVEGGVAEFYHHPNSTKEQKREVVEAIYREITSKGGQFVDSKTRQPKTLQEAYDKIARMLAKSKAGRGVAADPHDGDDRMSEDDNEEAAGTDKVAVDNDDEEEVDEFEFVEDSSETTSSDAGRGFQLQDVICGQGNCFTQNPGNVLCNTLVEGHLAQYFANNATTQEKHAIQEKIVRTIAGNKGGSLGNKGGRFVDYQTGEQLSHQKALDKLDWMFQKKKKKTSEIPIPCKDDNADNVVGMETGSSTSEDHEEEAEDDEATGNIQLGDVRCGPGNFPKHPGNLDCAKLVGDFFDDYFAEGSTKTAIAESIVLSITRRGNRFVDSKTGQEKSHEEALDKIALMFKWQKDSGKPEEYVVDDDTDDENYKPESEDHDSTPESENEDNNVASIGSKKKAASIPSSKTNAASINSSNEKAAPINTSKKSANPPIIGVEPMEDSPDVGDDGAKGMGEPESDDEVMPRAVAPPPDAVHGDQPIEGFPDLDGDGAKDMGEPENDDEVMSLAVASPPDAVHDDSPASLNVVSRHRLLKTGMCVSHACGFLGEDFSSSSREEKLNAATELLQQMRDERDVIKAWAKSQIEAAMDQQDPRLLTHQDSSPWILEKEEAYMQEYNLVYSTEGTSTMHHRQHGFVYDMIFSALEEMQWGLKGQGKGLRSRQKPLTVSFSDDVDGNNQDLEEEQRRLKGQGRRRKDRGWLSQQPPLTVSNSALEESSQDVVEDPESDKKVAAVLYSNGNSENRDEPEPDKKRSKTVHQPSEDERENSEDEVEQSTASTRAPGAFHPSAEGHPSTTFTGPHTRASRGLMTPNQGTAAAKCGPGIAEMPLPNSQSLAGARDDHLTPRSESNNRKTTQSTATVGDTSVPEEPTTAPSIHLQPQVPEQAPAMAPQVQKLTLWEKISLAIFACICVSVVVGLAVICVTLMVGFYMLANRETDIKIE